ncbi:EAL domain-containing protein [Paenibacillus soyae]|uniref:EAL domain-containing protein n=1 Tax=Paenibacillus soyae TaxID=2969249 RepID=A0A9X2MPZ8_9BACL|nr:EAL domain-containing protein [Paenibacillus soyae]MCR2804300.1 EAL domain-containing protein [Paenibacillus soyae]
MEQNYAISYKPEGMTGGSNRTRYLAVIGLLWDHSASGSQEGGKVTGEHWRAWTSLAERSIPEFVPSSHDKRMYQWLANDLFISFLWPADGGEHPESVLSARALRAASKLEREFIMAAPGREGGGKLRIGLSALACEAESYGDDLYYEAMKRAIVNAQSEGGAEQRLRGGFFSELLTERLIYPVYQPIFSLGSGEVFGFEALTRLPVNSWFRGPIDLFRFAEENGSLYGLDRLARELAIDGCLALRKEQKLFINVMAQIMSDPGFSPGRTISLLEEHHLSPHQVVFEITERSSIEDYPTVKKALQHYRSQGYRIAIDDVGAGYSSLQSIVELRPDYMKIDRSIIQNIHKDDVKAHILTTLQEVAGKIGSELIAEGIESKDELDKLVQMGIPYAQGYLLGRPAPFPG